MYLKWILKSFIYFLLQYERIITNPICTRFNVDKKVHIQYFLFSYIYCVITATPRPRCPSLGTSFTRRCTDWPSAGATRRAPPPWRTCWRPSTTPPSSSTTTCTTGASGQWHWVTLLRRFNFQAARSDGAKINLRTGIRLELQFSLHSCQTSSTATGQRLQVGIQVGIMGRADLWAMFD